ncbi:MAG: LapA family protein [Candidatus Hodarchaeales archaeon]
MAVERFSKTGLALLMLAIGFFLGLATGFIGAYHGSNFWYDKLQKENKQIEKRIQQLEQEKMEALERAIRIYQQDLEDIWPEEK